jgi:hypothetical protein
MTTPTAITRALERCDIPDQGFHHAQHLAVAWVYLSESPTIALAAARMAATLRRFAASCGHAEKYHHTTTVFWMRRLAAARASHPDASLDDILRLAPALLDKTLPLTYYSPERLFSEEARWSWLDSDLRPLDADASSSGATHPSGDPPDRALSRPRT